ncbi:MAG: phosphodiester glycosidase family protein [Gemmatimonadaceae bacterium]
MPRLRLNRLRLNRSVASSRGGALLLLAALGGCATATSRARASGTDWPWTVPATIADTIQTQIIAPGVRWHHLVRIGAPGLMRIEVLDVDLAACITPQALKGAPTAVGRTTTSRFLANLPAADRGIATINADFFSFTPDGVPVNLLVADGRLISGPVERPVFAMDSAGRPYIGRFSAAGAIVNPRGVRVPIGSWNRPSARLVGLVDAAWGQTLDTIARPGALQLIPVSGGTATAKRYRIATLPSYHSGLARGDTLMLIQSDRASLLVGDTVRVEPSLAPFLPTQAVGGFPLLVADSAYSATLDKDGAVSFRDRNPRSAIGVGAKGRRLLLAVIDGRQPRYSIGMTTRETAQLLRDLGAREAMNLDGGGSSALAVRDPATGAVRVLNKPSDPVERPVADVLALTGRCAAASPAVNGTATGR